MKNMISSNFKNSKVHGNSQLKCLKCLINPTQRMCTAISDMYGYVQRRWLIRKRSIILYEVVYDK